MTYKNFKYRASVDAYLTDITGRKPDELSFDDTIRDSRDFVRNSKTKVMRGHLKADDQEVCVKFAIPGKLDGVVGILREISIYERCLGNLSPAESEVVLRYIGPVYHEDFGFGIVTPYQASGTLEDAIYGKDKENIPSIDVVESVQYILRILMSYRVLGMRGVVHTDVSPGNLYCANGWAGPSSTGLLVGDFGSSGTISYYNLPKSVHNPGDVLQNLSNLVETGKDCFSGTRFTPARTTSVTQLHYIAAENALDTLERDSLSDLNSLAFLFFEILVGGIPYNCTVTNLVDFILNRLNCNLCREHFASVAVPKDMHRATYDAIVDLIISLAKNDRDIRGIIGGDNVRTPGSVIKYLVNLDWSGTSMEDSPVFEKAIKIADSI